MSLECQKHKNAFFLSYKNSLEKQKLFKNCIRENSSKIKITAWKIGIGFVHNFRFGSSSTISTASVTVACRSAFNNCHFWPLNKRMKNIIIFQKSQNKVRLVNIYGTVKENKKKVNYDIPTSFYFCVQQFHLDKSATFKFFVCTFFFFFWGGVLFPLKRVKKAPLKFSMPLEKTKNSPLMTLPNQFFGEGGGCKIIKCLFMAEIT